MRDYFWLVVLFILGLALRVIGLTNYPPGFTPDEAAFGYNAYSLLKTGHDEWGVPFYKLPLTNLESFGDYKLPLYAFLAVPTVKIFGLNEFATRLPNAIFGSLMVIVLFALAKKASKLNIALFAALVAAISPWGVQLSRGAFEANLITLLLPLFLALLLSQKYLLSTLILVLTFYSYHSARFLSLILVPVLFYKSKLHGLLLVMLVLPGLLGVLGSNSSRAADVSILSPTDSWRSVADRRFEAVQTGIPDNLARVFSNKVIYVSNIFINNYLSYLSLDFLFTQGARESTYGMIPSLGVLYPLEIIFLVSAAVYLIKHQKLSKRAVLFILLFFLSIVPAALAKGPGSAANRAAPMLPFLILFISFGLAVISKYIPALLIAASYVIFFAAFLETYLFHNRELYHGMLYGRREALIRVANLARDYDHVFVSTSLSEPHIYTAFYNQKNPGQYQKASRTWQIYHDRKLKFLDQLDGYSMDSYTFGRLKFNNPNSLYVGLPQDFPNSIKPMFTIDYPDGQPAIYVARL